MSAKKPNRNQLTNFKSSPLRQLTLNFGQKTSSDFTFCQTKTIECKECGMIYNSNDKNDEQLHLKYHNDQDSCLKYSSSFKNEKLVQDYFDGKVIVVEYGIDSIQSVNKSLQILEYVDKQLGINELNNQKDLLKRKSMINKNSKFYFFVDRLKNKIIGFCLAEQIDKAFRINENGYSYDETRCEKNTIICGINRIWVANDMRNKKIASRLLDCVCYNFFYVHKLQPSQLAFSDPTPNGKMLAKKYCKCDSFLVYNLNSNN